MTNKLKLISFDLCPYVQRSVIVMLEKGIEHERVYIDLKNKPDWFLQISPTGKVPVLQVEEKGELFESAVICEYLNEITPETLHPKDPFETAKHRSWIEFGSGILNSIGGFYSATNQETFEAKQKELQLKFGQVELAIKGPHFEGSSFYVVDAVYATIFRYFDVIESIQEFHFFTYTPKIQTWRKALSQRDSVKNAVLTTYHERLYGFFRNKGSYLTTLM